MGDTVNVALMVEKMGEGMKIHMSGTAKNQLEQVGGFRTEYRGILDMGQKLGQMETYWLLGPDKDYDMEMENLSNWTLEQNRNFAFKILCKHYQNIHEAC